MGFDTKRGLGRWAGEYARQVEAYVRQPSDDVLRKASSLGRRLLKKDVPPHDLAAAHLACIERLYANGGSEGQGAARAAGVLFVELMKAYATMSDDARTRGQSRARRGKRSARSQVGLVQADEARHAAGRHVGELLSASPAVLYSCGPGPEYPTTFISANVLAQFGYRPDEFYEDRDFWTKRIHAQDVERILQELSRIDQGERLTYEYRFRHKKGHHVWLHDELTPLKDERGNIVGLVGSWFDITRRKRAEEALRRERDTAQSYLDVAGVMFVALNECGEVTLINRKGCEILGYAEREIVGGNWFERFVPERLRREVSRGFQQLMAGEARAVEYYGNPVVTRGGQERLLAWHNTVLRDNEGRIVGTLSSGEDITERKRAEEALQRAHDELERRVAERTAELDQANQALRDKIVEHQRAEEALRTSEERYRTLTQHIPGMVYRARPDWTTELIINSRPICGYDAADFHSRRLDWRNVIHPDDRDRVFQEGSALAKSAKRLVQEYRIVTRYGAVRWVADHKRSFFTRKGDFGGIDGIVFDITQGKQAELALEESERRYRAIVEDQTEFICRWRPGFIYTFVNEAYCRCFGKSRDELLGRSFMTLIPEDERSKALEHFASLSRENPVATHEHRVLTAGGQIRWHQWTNRAISDEDGNIVEYQSCGRDVTKQRQAEEELRKFKTIADEAGYGVALSDLAGNLTYVNRSFAEMHGCKPSELIGKHVSVFHNDEQMPRVNTLVRLLAQQGRSFTAEEVGHTRADGSAFPALTSATVVKDEAGHPLFLAATVIDISERKQVEETLRRQALVFDNLYDAVIMTDAADRITDWNPGASRIFGYAREEVLGQTTDFLHLPARGAILAALIRDALRHGDHWSDQLSLLCKDGTKKRCEVVLMGLRDERAQFAGTIAIGRDVTDRLRAEEQARRRQEELAHVARRATMGEMATGLAHELNQSLQTIGNFAGGCALRLQTGACEVEEVLGILESIAECAERAGAFLSRLRDFVGRRCPQLLATDLNRVVRDSIEFTSYESRKQGVQVELKLADALRPASADDIQIMHVILNLVRNGIEAMQETDAGQRRLIVRTSEAGSEAVCVAVRDSGCGLPDEVENHLFEPFFTTKPSGEGMGMGLAISRSIIEAHGGRLWATPNPDRGTTFLFTLPVCQRKRGRR